MTSNIKPVILCGGSGTRLWPISRQNLPKQFVDFPINNLWGNCLFQLALNRIQKSQNNVKVLPPFIVALNEYRFLIKNQLQISNTTYSVFLEPTPRNTAASLTMAALATERDDPILVVLPSDQIMDDAKLLQAINLATESVECGEIVLLGVKPTFPETGYGYIKTTSVAVSQVPIRVDSFTEKPNLEKAITYLKDGTYLWNSGIFILKSSTWLNALKQCRPDIELAAKEAWKSRRLVSEHEITVSESAFESIPKDSIDYAVIENAKSHQIDVSVIPFDGFWSDLGSWKAVHDNLPKDTKNNFALGQAFLRKSRNCLALATSRPIVLNGVQNLAVVETCDAVLVTDLDHTQFVKEIVEDLKVNKISQALAHRKINRPWGWFDTLHECQNCKVKHIVVYPGEQLSLQRHKYRDENWTIISGHAAVQIGEKVLNLTAGESIRIPCHELHRLTNSEDCDLHIIEVQTGTNLSEDDIERLDDKYGRL